MKTKLLFATIIILLSISKLQAQETKENIKVNGVCTMCKSRIEKTALSVKGVKSAKWNIKTHILTVIYDKKITNSDKIQKAIAKVGHDTEKYKADDKAYNSLPKCCHYQRTYFHSPKNK
jgi:copper chaperone CopZ